MEKVTLNSGERMTVHDRRDCEGPCPVHGPSDHHMVKWPLHWRDDRQIFERICEHGWGHPDPDTMQHIYAKRGPKEAELEGIHGCDGCCKRPDVLWSPTS